MATNIVDRFFSQVERIPFSGCWIWVGCTTPRMYGQIMARGGNVISTHRLSWELHNGTEVPDGMHVLHTCDIPCCVNPSHLFLGTHDDNMKDMKRKNRAKGLAGTLNHKAKLSTDDVDFIKSELSKSLSCVDLAKRFGVVHSTITRIRRGDGWITKAPL